MDIFPQYSFMADATNYHVVQCAGDLGIIKKEDDEEVFGSCMTHKARAKYL